MRDYAVRLLFFLLGFTAILSSGCTQVSVVRQAAKARAAQEAAKEEVWEFAKRTVAERRPEVTGLSFFPSELGSVVSTGMDNFSVRGYGSGFDKQNKTPVFIKWTLSVKRSPDNRWQSLSSSTSARSGPNTPYITYVGLVPLGRESEAPAREMAAYFDQKLSLKMKLLPALEVPAAAVHPQRNQAAADALVTLMKRRYLKSIPTGALLIGVTGQDIYSRDEAELRFVFSSRFVTEQARYAVISTARLDPANLGQGPDPSLLQSRLRKMALKNIGILQYELSPSSDPRSFLYTPILELRDIDTMGDGF